MANYLRPKRGKNSSALSQNLILRNGEIFFEVPETGVGTGEGKLKMGDGITSYADLPYFLEIKDTDVSELPITFKEDESDDKAILLNKITSGNKLSVIVGAQRKLLSILCSAVTKLNNDLENYLPLSGGTIYNSAGALLNITGSGLNGDGSQTISGFTSITAVDFSGNLDGLASKATSDASGNNIKDTYATKTEMNGKLGKTETAIGAFADGSGNNIKDTYATKTELSTGLSGKLGKTETAANADKLDNHDSTYFATANHGHPGLVVVRRGSARIVKGEGQWGGSDGRSSVSLEDCHNKIDAGDATIQIGTLSEFPKTPIFNFYTLDQSPNKSSDDNYSVSHYSAISVRSIKLIGNIWVASVVISHVQGWDIDIMLHWTAMKLADENSAKLSDYLNKDAN